MIKKILFIVLVMAFSTPTLGSIYKYTELQTKDLDQMRDFVKLQIAASDKTLQSKKMSEDEAIQEAVDTLRDALKFVLSRPDRDNMVSKLLPMVRTPLKALNSYEDSLAFLTTQAIHSVGNDRVSAAYRATSLYILQNIMSEMQPLLGDSSEALRIYKKIHDAKIEVPKAVSSHIKKYGTYKRADSPSDIAEAVLKKSGLLKKK